MGNSKDHRTWFGVCKEVGLNEQARRDVQARVTGKESASAMTDADFRACVADLRQRKLWAPKLPAGEDGRQVRMSSKPHVKKLYALGKELSAVTILKKPFRDVVRGLVKRMIGRDDPEWLNAEEATKVAEALKAWIVREKAKKSAVSPGVPG